MKWGQFTVSLGIILLLLFASNLSQKIRYKTNISKNNFPTSASPTHFVYIVITTTPIPTNTPKPTRTPTPTPKILTSSQIDELFTNFSNQYSVSRDLLVKIAVCESHLNPNAVNGIYGGMFQFSTSSWITMRRMMNVPNNPTLRFDPEEAIKTAAFKLSVGGIGAWPNCGK